MNKKQNFTFTWKPKGEAQRNATELYKMSRIMFMLGIPGSGKSFMSLALALSDVLKSDTKKLIITRPQITVGEDMGYFPGPQPLDVKIATPEGWTTMGELSIGSRVIGQDGRPTTVVGIYPKGKKMVYKVTTTDGTSTECCADHLWLTTTPSNRKYSTKGSIKSTSDIIKTLYTKNGKIYHHIPRNKAVEYTKKNLPLSPYVLGCLLGDGYLGEGISVCGIDKEIMERVNRELIYVGCKLSNSGNTITYGIKRIENSDYTKTGRKVRLTNTVTGVSTIFDRIGIALKEVDLDRNTLGARCASNTIIDNIKYEFLPLEARWVNPVKNIIDDLGLLYKKAPDKFVPEIYKYTSVEDRLALLQGLMDTDGTVKKTGEASFTTVSKQLAEDVIEIVRSLGGRATLRSRDRRGTKTRLLNNRLIHTKLVSYEFTISLPENLNPFYLPRKRERFKCRYIHGVGIKAIEPIGEKEVQCIKVDNHDHLYLTDNFIVTHNTLEEKMANWLGPVYDVFSSMSNDTEWEKLTRTLDGRVEVIPLGLMRGRTIRNAVCVAEEMQNARFSQLKCLLTRLGEGGKILLNGDIEQSDKFSPDESPLADVANRLQDLDTVSVVTFGIQDQARDPLINDILERL